jgi:hypothetical protein
LRHDACAVQPVFNDDEVAADFAGQNFQQNRIDRGGDAR